MLRPAPPATFGSAVLTAGEGGTGGAWLRTLLDCLGMCFALGNLTGLALHDALACAGLDAERLVHALRDLPNWLDDIRIAEDRGRSVLWLVGATAAAGAACCGWWVQLQPQPQPCTVGISSPGLAASCPPQH